ncbi:MAG TPA: phosphohydrolase [Lachnospiraceae bacterium]|nr:phosphohydrolase [Lachnospiraceae bacterium]
MFKKKVIVTASVAAIIACQPLFAIAGAAPDGKTLAQFTSAAANGKYDAWETEWSSISKDWTQVSLTPGSDETKINFAWYSKSGSNEALSYGTSPNLDSSTTVTHTQTKAQEGYVSNKATITLLEPNTTYYYRVGNREINSFKTQNTSSFSFVFVGDPQIGSSNAMKAKKPEDIAVPEFATAQYEAVESDTFNWNNTLEMAIKQSKEMPSFILSAGDQIQTNAKKVDDISISEIEYAGYLSPDILESLPVATTVGNHDSDNPNYTWHFNTPNLSTLGSNNIVGGDYYFRHGKALFIMLNTQDTNSAEHKKFIEETVKANKDCKWKIVTLHQDIYGSAEHSNEPEITNLRYELVPIFEANDIDVVLTGHDHAYSRSYILKGGVKTTEYTDDEFDSQLEKDLENGESKATLTVGPMNILYTTTDADEITYLTYLREVMDKKAVVSTENTVVNPDGILYMTAGSSSGSKYYDLSPRKQTYVANRWQEDIPTYSLVEIDNDSFTINTYRTDTNEKIDTEMSIIKK